MGQRHGAWVELFSRFDHTEKEGGIIRIGKKIKIKGIIKSISAATAVLDIFLSGLFIYFYIALSSLRPMKAAAILEILVSYFHLDGGGGSRSLT